MFYFLNSDLVFKTVHNLLRNIFDLRNLFIFWNARNEMESKTIALERVAKARNKVARISIIRKP